MAYDITRFSPFARLAPFLEDDDFPMVSQSSSGLSISEDEKHVYIAAAVPGIDVKDVEITLDKNMLWIKGEARQEEEDKKKKFYRKASSSFSYRITVPGEIDWSKEAEATYKNGIMTVAFTKSPQSQPKKISVKTS